MRVVNAAVTLQRAAAVAEGPEYDVERTFDVFEVPFVQLDLMAEELSGNIRGEGVVGVHQRNLHDPAAKGERKQPEASAHRF